MNQRCVPKTGRNFIRVMLHSGTANNPMGDEELAIFCRCDNEKPTIKDVDLRQLLQWVNTNPDCKRNQSNERYRLSRQADAVSVIYLSDVLSCISWITQHDGIVFFEIASSDSLLECRYQESIKSK